MAETGIEDFAKDPLGGCFGALLPAVIFAVVLFVGIGLLSAYCGSGPKDGLTVNNSNSKPA